MRAGVAVSDMFSQARLLSRAAATLADAMLADAALAVADLAAASTAIATARRPRSCHPSRRNCHCRPRRRSPRSLSPRTRHRVWCVEMVSHFFFAGLRPAPRLDFFAGLCPAPRSPRCNCKLCVMGTLC